MAIQSRADAQRRADQIRTFNDELARLEREGVLSLTPEQRAALESHQSGALAALEHDFDIDRDARGKQLSLGMRVASFLGALALSASVFFLFYQFWGRFGTPAQVSILVAASLLTFGGTVLLDRVDGTGYFTKLAAMVAFACFVLNIAMLGQIFDITPSDRALLPWAALALVLAYLSELRLLLAAAILCLVAYLSARTGTWGGMYWLDFGRRPENFFPAAIALFCVPSLVRHARHADFPAVYRVFGVLTLFVPMLVLANYGEASHLDWKPDVIEGCYQALGFAGTAVFIGLGARRGWGETVNTALVLFVIFLYTKFYDWWWAVMPKYLFFFVLGLTALLFLFVLRRLRALAPKAERP